MAGGDRSAQPDRARLWQISTSILLATAQDDMPAFLEAVRQVEASLNVPPSE